MIDLFIIATGLLTGSLHVFTGPDHLAAVAPLAVDQRRGMWKSGFYWGLGHSTGVAALTALAMLFREALPVDSISTWSERFVGVVLISVALWGWRRATRQVIHIHVHEHDGVRHAHAHQHDAAQIHNPDVPAVGSHSHHHGALGIGALHGLAGTSHLLGVMPALLLPSRSDAAAYVLGFCIGSVLAMMVFSTLVGWVAARVERVTATGYRRFLFGCCAMVFGVGVFWIIKGFSSVGQ